MVYVFVLPWYHMFVLPWYHMCLYCHDVICAMMSYVFALPWYHVCLYCLVYSVVKHFLLKAQESNFLLEEEGCIPPLSCPPKEKIHACPHSPKLFGACFKVLK